MTDRVPNAIAAARQAGYTCIAQHAVELTHKYKRLILPAPATAHSYMGETDPTRTLTAFTFEDGSELSADLTFSGNRVDAYWSNEGSKG